MVDITTDDAGTRQRTLPCHEVERTLCTIWSGLFGAEVSPYDDFYDLGGDSLTVIDMVLAARERGIQVRSSVALRHPTPARLAEHLTLDAEAPVPGPGGRSGWWWDAANLPAVGPDPADGAAATVTAAGPEAPLFVLHSAAHLAAERRAVATWRKARPVVGILPPGLGRPLPSDATIEQVAAEQLGQLSAFQPVGDRYLVGFGHGAVVAFELARQLARRGDNVALVTMVGPPDAEIGPDAGSSVEDLLERQLAALARRFGLTGDESPEDLLTRARQADWYDSDVPAAALPRLERASAELAAAGRRYRPGRFDGPVVLAQDRRHTEATLHRWGPAAPNLRIHPVEYGLDSPRAMIEDRALAELVRTELSR